MREAVEAMIRITLAIVSFNQYRLIVVKWFLDH
jgi:hypothetical protein